MLQETVGFTLPGVSKLDRVRDWAWDRTPPSIDWSIKRSVAAGDNPLKVSAVFKQHLCQRYRHHQHIFTDGSKAQGNVGVGVYGEIIFISHKLHDMCSVFSAEVAALLSAVDETNTNERTVIFTDSASALQALQNPRNKHLWVKILESLCGPHLTFCWVPGHCGIAGNERADRLADEGRNGDFWETDIPSADIRKWLAVQLRNKWESEWFSVNSNFTRRIKPTTHVWKDRALHQERKVLSRLRTGHTRLTHSHLLSRGSRP